MLALVFVPIPTGLDLYELTLCRTPHVPDLREHFRSNGLLGMCTTGMATAGLNIIVTKIGSHFFRTLEQKQKAFTQK